MKTTVQAPLSFDCEYIETENDLVFFHVQARIDQYNFLGLGYRNFNYSSSYSSDKKRCEEESVLELQGICEKKIFFDFVNNPSTDNLEYIKNSYKKHKDFILVEKSLFQKLLSGEILEEYFQGEIESLQEEITSITKHSFNFIEKIVSSNEYFLVEKNRIHSKSNIAIKDCSFKTVYFSSSFSLDKVGGLVVDPYSAFDQQQQSLLEDITLCNDPLENKLRFLNHMIEVQNTHHLFTDISFTGFISEHCNQRIESNRSLTKNDLLPLEDFLAHEDDWKPRSAEILPQVVADDKDQYDRIFREAEEIVGEYNPHNPPPILAQELLEVMMLAKKGVYQLLSINFSLFSKQYFLSSDYDDDYGYNKEKYELEKQQIIDKLNKWYIKQQLEKDLSVNDQASKKYKI